MTLPNNYFQGVLSHKAHKNVGNSVRKSPFLRYHTEFAAPFYGGNVAYHSTRPPLVPVVLRTFGAANNSWNLSRGQQQLHEMPGNRTSQSIHDKKGMLKLK